VTIETGVWILIAAKLVPQARNLKLEAAFCDARHSRFFCGDSQLGVIFL